MLFHLIFQFKYGLLHVFNLCITLRCFLLQFQAGSAQLFCLMVTYLLQVRIILFYLEWKGRLPGQFNRKELLIHQCQAHPSNGKGSSWHVLSGIISIFLASGTAKAINIQRSSMSANSQIQWVLCPSPQTGAFLFCSWVQQRLPGRLWYCTPEGGCPPHICYGAAPSAGDPGTVPLRLYPLPANAKSFQPLSTSGYTISLEKCDINVMGSTSWRHRTETWACTTHRSGTGQALISPFQFWIIKHFIIF